MKTYVYKKPVYSEIANVQELCRLCLGKTEEGIPIFKDDQDVCAAVAMRIMICVGLEMRRENLLPNKICKMCHDELEKYYKFRKKCAESYQKLKYHLLAIKLKKDDVNKASMVDETSPSEKAEERQQDVQIVDEEERDEEKQLVIQMSEEPEVVENVAEKAVEMEEVQCPVLAEINPDIGTFLTGVLVELGILQRQEAGMLLHRGIESFELETGGGEQLTLELVEEDDETLASTSTVLKLLKPVENVPEIKQEPTLLTDISSKLKTKPKELKTEGEGAGAGAGARARPWCGRCGRAFSSRSAAARHARAHAGARPHACALCAATFAQKSVLQRHMLVHLDVRPHQCPSCDKSFTQRGALAAHARSHAAPHERALRLHACAHCDKVFLHTSGLSRHMLQHSGREFSCSACERRFKDKGSLRRHLKTVFHEGHNNIVPKIASKNTPKHAPRENISRTVTDENISGTTTGENISGITTAENISGITTGDNVSGITTGENVSGITTGENVSGTVTSENTSGTGENISGTVTG